MKRQLACVVLAVAAAALSGCYYDPGYSYVRGSGYGGDAYYGSGSTYYAAPGYYDGYYPAYYGGYYGCCYAPGVSIGFSGYWQGGSHYLQVGVVHRDIKPDNIFLARKEHDPHYTKVLDFGVAKLLTPIGDIPRA